MIKGNSKLLLKFSQIATLHNALYRINIPRNHEHMTYIFVWSLNIYEAWYLLLWNKQGSYAELCVISDYYLRQ